MSLTQDLKWLLEQSSALQASLSSASNWFVTLYTVNWFSQWAMVKNMAVSDLAFLILYIYVSNEGTIWVIGVHKVW